MTQVAHADPLVVDRRERGHEAARLRPRRARAARRCDASSPQALQVVEQRLQLAARRERSPASGCPGLTCCGSRIQPARLPGVFGIVAAPSESRLARWRQVGPDRAARVRARRSCGSTRTPSRARPAGLARASRSAAAAPALPARASHALELRRAAPRRRTSAMCACWSPQNSAHWPRKTPALSARRRRPSFVRPGIMSIFRFSCGHPEAVDHVAARRRGRAPGTPTGMWISFAVRTPCRRIARRPRTTAAP